MSREKAFSDLIKSFQKCQKEGFRFSAFGDALIITNIEDKKQGIIGPDKKIINLGRKAIRINFDEDGMIV